MKATPNPLLDPNLTCWKFRRQLSEDQVSSLNTFTLRKLTSFMWLFSSFSLFLSCVTCDNSSCNPESCRDILQNVLFLTNFQITYLQSRSHSVSAVSTTTTNQNSFANSNSIQSSRLKAFLQTLCQSSGTDSAVGQRFGQPVIHWPLVAQLMFCVNCS